MPHTERNKYGFCEKRTTKQKSLVDKIQNENKYYKGKSENNFTYLFQIHNHLVKVLLLSVIYLMAVNALMSIYFGFRKTIIRKVKSQTEQ